MFLPLFPGVFVCVGVLQNLSMWYIFLTYYLENFDSTVYTDFNVYVFIASTMWLCHHPYGSVLVYRVYASGCDCLVAGCPLPDDGHHGGWTGMINIYIYSSDVPVLCFFHQWLLLYSGRRKSLSLFFLYYVAPFWASQALHLSLMPSKSISLNLNRKHQGVKG